MALTTSVTLQINTLYTNPLDLSTPTDNMALDKSITFTSGTTADKADVIWHESYSLADDGTNTHALSDSSLTDPLGNAVDMVELKLLFIENTSTDANLRVGGAGANSVPIFTDVSDIIEIPPGGKFLWTSPTDGGVTVSTNEDLKLLHDGTGSSALVYNIVAIGTSA